MADIVDRKTRSRMMASIKGRNTRPEMALRKALHSLGFRYRLHDRKLPGHPDLVFPKYKAVVFVHGCFWHRHAGCRYATTPASNMEFWERKFYENIKRDSRNMEELLKSGWRVAVVWECALKDEDAETVAREVARWLSNGGRDLEIPHPSRAS